MAISVNRTATLGKPKNLTKPTDQARQLVVRSKIENGKQFLNQPQKVRE
jgi:hypothetical protein